MSKPLGRTPQLASTNRFADVGRTRCCLAFNWRGGERTTAILAVIKPTNARVMRFSSVEVSLRLDMIEQAIYYRGLVHVFARHTGGRMVATYHLLVINSYGSKR